MAYKREGLTEFPVSGVARGFKYAVSVADERLQIWLEDSVTRDQWQTDPLAIVDFTTMDTTLPRAEAADYAVHIAECLELTPASTKTTRWLSSSADGSTRELCVGFELQALTFSASLEYTFALKAVVLSPMDVLMSRVWDLETMMLELKQENGKLQAEVDALAVQLQTTPYQLFYAALVSLFECIRDWVSTVDYQELMGKCKDQTRRLYDNSPTASEFGAFILWVLHACFAVLGRCFVGVKFVGSGVRNMISGGEQGPTSVKPGDSTKAPVTTATKKVI